MLKLLSLYSFQAIFHYFGVRVGGEDRCILLPSQLRGNEMDFITVLLSYFPLKAFAFDVYCKWSQLNLQILLLFVRLGIQEYNNNKKLLYFQVQPGPTEE